MKTWHLFLGIAEIILALVAVFLAITSNHPLAWLGYVLALSFGSKGLLYILAANESESEEAG